MMNEPAPRFRFLGTTDESVTCEKCGKDELRSTVMIVPLDIDGNDDGEVTYYGSSCAARALGVTGRGAAAKVLAAAKGADWQTRGNAENARRMLAFYGLPETGQPDVLAMMTAVERYQAQHASAMWASEKTRGDWFDMVRDMIAREQSALADARALKIHGY